MVCNGFRRSNERIMRVIATRWSIDTADHTHSAVQNLCSGCINHSLVRKYYSSLTCLQWNQIAYDGNVSSTKRARNYTDCLRSVLVMLSVKVVAMTSEESKPAELLPLAFRWVQGLPKDDWVTEWGICWVLFPRISEFQGCG